MMDQNSPPLKPGFQFRPKSERHYTPPAETILGSEADALLPNYRELTPQAMEAINRAHEPRMRLQHNSLELPHLLLGLLAEPEPMISRAFSQVGLSLDALRIGIEAALQPGKKLQLGYVPSSASVVHAQVQAREAAQAQGRLIGTDDLLLSILAESDPVIAQVLSQLGYSKAALLAAFDVIFRKEGDSPLR